MKKKNIYIFFDDVMGDYIGYYGKMGEEEAVKGMKRYLRHLSKTSKITIITHEDVVKIKEWFLKNDLFKFVDNISNPVKYFTLLNNPDFLNID